MEPIFKTGEPIDLVRYPPDDWDESIPASAHEPEALGQNIPF